MSSHDFPANRKARFRVFAEGVPGVTGRGRCHASLLAALLPAGLSLILALPAAAADTSRLAAAYARIYKVPAAVVTAVIFVESSGQAAKKGDDGLSLGLMQIQHATAKDMGFAGTAAELLQPEVNIKYGVKYLRWCLDQTGDINTALDAYNRGIANVLAYPFKGEWTEHRYVGRVLRAMAELEKTALAAEVSP